MWEDIYKLIIANIQLILGWFLGLLSVVVVDSIKKYFLKKEVKSGIVSEIKQIQYLTIGFCVTTTLESKLLSEDWSNWFKPYYERFFLSGEFEYQLDSNETGDKIKELFIGKSNEEFYKHMLLLSSINDDKKNRTGLTITKLSIPYLNTNFGSISLFKEKFQSLLYKFRREVDLINSDAEQLWYYHTRTFDKISDINHDVVVKNINNIISRVARRSKGLIKLTQKIIDY